MVLGIGDAKLQALQLQTAAYAETGTVGTGTIGTVNLHLSGTQGIVADSNIELWRQDEVGTDNDVAAYTILPVVKTHKGGRQAQR